MTNTRSTGPSGANREAFVSRQHRATSETNCFPKSAERRTRAHTVGAGLKAAAPTGRVFLLIWQAWQIASSLSPAAGFEVRPKGSAGKIERPTAVRTVFEGPGG